MTSWGVFSDTGHLAEVFWKREHPTANDQWRVSSGWGSVLGCLMRLIVASLHYCIQLQPEPLAGDRATGGSIPEPEEIKLKS